MSFWPGIVSQCFPSLNYKSVRNIGRKKGEEGNIIAVLRDRPNHPHCLLVGKFLDNVIG